MHIKIAVQRLWRVQTDSTGLVEAWIYVQDRFFRCMGGLSALIPIYHTQRFQFITVLQKDLRRLIPILLYGFLA